MKSFLPAALLLVAAGCTDLDVDIKSQYTDFPDSEAAIEAVSAEIYSSYRSAYGGSHWMVQTLSGDEAVAVALGTDYYDGGRYRDLHLHWWTADHPMLPDMWDGAMSGVTSCNKIMAMLEGMGEEAFAPMRAMRAFYYFILMDNFGAVPIMRSQADGQQERSPRADVCRFIESELLEVRDLLPTNVDNSTYGRATRYMADALLAKLYLNWAVYTASDVTAYTPGMTNGKLNDVVAMCDDIIASGNFNLNDDFMTKFRPDNGPQIKDFIFVMPYDHERQQGMVHARFWSHRSGQKQFCDFPSSVAGIMRCLPDYYDKFCLEGDDRNASYITGLQYYWDNYERTDRPFVVSTTKSGVDQDYQGADRDEPVEWHVELTKELRLRPNNKTSLDCGNDQLGRSMGYRLIKFYIDAQTKSNENRSQSNDVPIFRYADILLMKAEAILRGATATSGDSPMSLMNQIRSYVHAPMLTAEPTLDDLLDERAREFADESWRRNDLIRFGQFEKDCGFRREVQPERWQEEFRRIFPVPTSVMNVNTNWEQNPGY